MMSTIRIVRECMFGDFIGGKVEGMCWNTSHDNGMHSAPQSRHVDGYEWMMQKYSDSWTVLFQLDSQYDAW